MGILQKLVSKFSENKGEYKQKFKEAEMDLKIQRTLEQRHKSSNERELESHIKQQREANIKKELDRIRQKKTEEMWKQNSFLGKKATILKDDRPILKEKNIFKNNKSKRGNL
jgi:predicted Holliday junction resolvase-like endonuclease